MTDGSPEDTGTHGRRRRPATATCRTTAPTIWRKMTATGCFTTTTGDRESTEDIARLDVTGIDAGRRQGDVRDATWSRNRRWTMCGTMSSMSSRCRRPVQSYSAPGHHAVSSTNALDTLDVDVLLVPLESTVNKASASTLLEPTHSSSVFLRCFTFFLFESLYSRIMVAATNKTHKKNSEKGKIRTSFFETNRW